MPQPNNKQKKQKINKTMYIKKKKQKQYSTKTILYLETININQPQIQTIEKN